MSDSSEWFSQPRPHFCILTHWRIPAPDSEIRNFKLSCLNNWFLVRTCLSKPLPLLDASVSREVLGVPEKCFWVYRLFSKSDRLFTASPSHGRDPKEAGDRGGWGLWEDLPPHCLQQGPIPRGLRPYCLRELHRRHRGGRQAGDSRAPSRPTWNPAPTLRTQDFLPHHPHTSLLHSPCWNQ